MKKTILTISAYLFFTASFFSQTAFATEKNVALHAPTMNCPVCPITVRKALKKIDGVLSVESNFEEKTFVITFDDQKTTEDILKNATSDAGYPSTVISEEKGNKDD